MCRNPIRKYVQTKMPEIEDPKEQSDIVEAAANSMMDEDITKASVN